jgi:hypothetical protein
VEVKPSYIEFKHPLLPFECHKFLRFSSKISGSHSKGVEKSIDTVTRVAKTQFGSRVPCLPSTWAGLTEIAPERNRMHEQIIEASECLKNWRDRGLIVQQPYTPEDNGPDECQVDGENGEHCGPSWDPVSTLPQQY